MAEFAHRMLTNRPTVARTSEGSIWVVGRSPNRAKDPRTEITRPKDVTVVEPQKLGQKLTMRALAGETVKRRLLPIAQISGISIGFLAY